MSLFKQVHNAILSGTSINQSSPSSLSRIVNTKKWNAQQKEAQVMIATSPASAKGYFFSARTYREQDDLCKALNVYLQGLESVSPDDPQYHLLLIEKKSVARKLEQRNQDGFYHMLPYDILCLIFGNLENMDLLQCACVCQRWFDFMLEWPGFWDKMSRVDKSTLELLLRGQTQELYLDGPFAPGLMQGIFSVLGIEKVSSSIQKIYLHKIKISTLDMQLLGAAARCMLSSLKQVDLVDCPFKREDIIQNLLPACSSGLTRVSFSRKVNPSLPKSYFRGRLVDAYSSIITLNISPATHAVISPKYNSNYYSTLTYIKIGSFTNYRHGHDYNDSFTILTLVTTMIKKCPNLVHLFLASYDADAHLGDCFLQAIKSCPRLKNVIVSRDAQMPKTKISNIDDIEYSINIASSTTSPSSSSTINTSSSIIGAFKKSFKMEDYIITDASSSTSPGIRRLVLANYNLDLQTNHVLEVLKHSYASLELLYLEYYGRQGIATLLSELATYGCPRLREIHLSGSRPTAISVAPVPPITQTLVRLFSGCPALEAVELEEMTNGRAYYHLQADKSVLSAIAKYCPKIRHLCIFAESNIWMKRRDYPCNDLLSLIHRKDDNKESKHSNIMIKGKDVEQQSESQLEYLKILGVDPETAYALVKNLVSLKHLRVSCWIGINGKNNERYDASKKLMESIKKILEERGGSLITSP
ncbi:hypothetical protein BDA99DRAFT_529031 [Phascolomyces articulosus]|uniref:F-box domain-containing protein n=1 Tax=Phascolomyces articulosus TaxID=60185 RepID=A0AAD5JWV5_9FUNG|nr:hypothetical protein BDA99DRAFT_529031 [Phascolomyces articulosus]